MPHTTDNGIAIAIEEAKNMIEKWRDDYRKSEQGEYLTKIEAMELFIQRLEARAEVATEEHRENYYCEHCKEKKEVEEYEDKNNRYTRCCSTCYTPIEPYNM